MGLKDGIDRDISIRVYRYLFSNIYFSHFPALVIYYCFVSCPGLTHIKAVIFFYHYPLYTNLLWYPLNRFYYEVVP